MTPRTVVIVGASLAGASAAQSLRAEGFDGRVVLLGEEPELPYERPPLSKGYLTGDTPRGQVYLHELDSYADNDIDLRTGTRVAALDLSSSQVVLEAGQRLGFDRLLLATGASPRRLQGPGVDLDGIHYLRDLSDADALRDRLRSGGKLVVIGAGWIGAEIAASARQHGLDVTVLDPAPVPPARVLGPKVGGFFRDLPAAWCGGTPPTSPGTAPATAPASTPPARCCADRPRRNSNPSSCRPRPLGPPRPDRQRDRPPQQLTQPNLLQELR